MFWLRQRKAFRLEASGRSNLRMIRGKAEHACILEPDACERMKHICKISLRSCVSGSRGNPVAGRRECLSGRPTRGPCLFSRPRPVECLACRSPPPPTLCTCPQQPSNVGSFILNGSLSMIYICVEADSRAAERRASLGLAAPGEALRLPDCLSDLFPTQASGASISTLLYS